MNKTIKMGRIRSTVLLAAVILLSQGCRKNEEYITQQTSPLNLGIRLTVDNSQVEANAFGAICTNEVYQIVRISNKPELLSGALDPLDMDTGDFIMIKETANGNTNYALLYIFENDNSNISEFTLLIDNLTEIDNFDLGENYVEGSHSGLFQSTDGTTQLQYDLSFISELNFEPELCQ